MYVCMYIYVYIYMYICKYVTRYMQIRLRMSTTIYAPMRIPGL